MAYEYRILKEGNPYRNEKQFPYLRRSDSLTMSFPCLGPFLHRLTNTGDSVRRLVNGHFRNAYGNYHPPGRCYVLEFWSSSQKSRTHPKNPSDTRDSSDYLQQTNLLDGQSGCSHRLYILEDLSPEYVDILGWHLDVDPLVIAAQAHFWKFLSATGSIPQRTLPSLTNPSRSFLSSVLRAKIVSRR
ncbi:hypothetical protein BCR34DRAFT_553337 [Clohesyomyces aquaticus]|uniref:Uncharacterized protein n=1 Tax=Clohesyomyces aquaticus TaxID=1231657 RepID=A0A1Y2A863_9PLEO|nr:hypothetical protein BCR34DRAFT_553337 [Clohesyomyces aquaticus]